MSHQFSHKYFFWAQVSTLDSLPKICLIFHSNVYYVINSDKTIAYRVVDHFWHLTKVLLIDYAIVFEIKVLMFDVMPVHSPFIYLKFLLVWALVLLADFILEFRFEYLWPFWLLLRSVYDSFKYQGLVCLLISFILSFDMNFNFFTKTKINSIIVCKFIFQNSSPTPYPHNSSNPDIPSDKR